MGVGLTFDTGALIGLERKHIRIAQVFAAATRFHTPITVPTAVVTEWWRARNHFRTLLLASVVVETLDESLSKLAGEALAAVPGATAIDAIVMASAARRGDVVFTSDWEDLTRLQAHFPNVRVMRV